MDQKKFDKEIEDLKGKLNLSLHPKDDNTSAMIQWNKFYPKSTPKQIYNKLISSVGYNNKIKIEIEFYPNENKSYIDINHGSNNNSNNVIDFEISLNGKAKLRSFSLATEEQGNGLAKKYLGGLVDILKQNHVKTISLGAWEIGGYAWAKYGFCPETPKEWDFLKTAIKERINTKNKTIEFSGETYPITASELTAINKIMDSKFLELPQNFPQLTELIPILNNFHTY